MARIRGVAVPVHPADYEERLRRALAIVLRALERKGRPPEVEGQSRT